MPRKLSGDRSDEPRDADIGPLVRMGTRQLESFLEAQSSLVQQAQEASESWLKRWQDEGALTSDVAVKLASARTIPDATAAWQHWVSQHMTWMSEDMHRASTQAQALMATSARALMGSWSEVRHQVLPSS